MGRCLMISIRKLLLVCALLPLSVSLYAQEGAYVGGSLAWSQAAANFRGAGLNKRVNKKDNGMNGAFYFGLDEKGDLGFFALELNAEIASGKLKLKQDNAAVKLSTKSSYGAGFLMGLNMTSGIAAYTRIGWQQVSFKASGEHDGHAISKKKRHDGMRYGLGVKFDLMEKFDIRFEAYRTHFQRKKYSDAGFRIKPVENAAALSFSYHFN